jgi:hypothetical protein
MIGGDTESYTQTSIWTKPITGLSYFIFMVLAENILGYSYQKSLDVTHYYFFLTVPLTETSK